MTTHRHNNDDNADAVRGDLPILYMDYTMAQFRRNIRLPSATTDHYTHVYEHGMEMSDPVSGARMLVVPRAKRPHDPSYITAADLDALAANGVEVDARCHKS